MKITDFTPDQLKSMIQGPQMLVDGRYYTVEEITADTGWTNDDAQQILEAIHQLIEIE